MNDETYTNTSKRYVSALVPFRRTAAGPVFYMQKRDMNARASRGKYGLFGGGVEGEETAEEALLREIQEELRYTPTNHAFYSRFESSTNIAYIFFEEVDETFESKVTVCEGEYGKFLSPEEILYAQDVSLLAQLIIYRYIREKLAILNYE